MPYSFDSDDIRTYLARQYRQARGRAKSVLRRPVATFPRNDNFAQRVTLNPSGGLESFNNTGYTLELGEPNTTPSISRTGWYKITPTDRQIFRFRITAIPASATVKMEFYRGTGSPLSNLQRLTTRWSTRDGGDSAQTNPLNGNLGWDASRLNDWMEFQLPDDEIQIQIGVTNSAHQGTITFEWEDVAPPANDDWADAIELVGDLGTESGTLEGATWDTALSDPTIAGNAWPNYILPSTVSNIEWETRLRGVAWYTINALSKSTYRFTLETTGTGTDMRICVLTGEDYPSQIRYGWGMPDETTDVELDTSQYWIAVAALNVGAANEYDFTRWRDTFDLHWEKLDNPANDDFENPEIISGDTGTSTLTDIEGATDESTPPATHGTVWFEFTPTNPGLYTIETNSALSEDTLATLYVLREESTQTFIAQAQHDPNTPAPMSVQVGLNDGDTYYIRLAHDQWRFDMYSHLADTDYGGLSWNLDTAAPTNDDWEDAEVISGSSGSVPGTTTASSMQTGEPGQIFDFGMEIPFSYLYSVWYEWEAPSTGYFRFETVPGAGSPDHDLAIFTGGVLTSLTPVVENLDGQYPENDFAAILEFQATEGETYWVRVSSFSVNSSGDFDLEWQTATPPANDDFEDAIVLASTQSGGPTPYDNLGADEEFETDEPDLSDVIDPDTSISGRSIWFSWVPPTSSTYAFTLDAPAFAGYLVVYELNGAASFGNLTRLDFVDVSYESTEFVQFVANSAKTYYFQVLGTWESAFAEVSPAMNYGIPQGQFELSWVRVPTPPGNDNLNLTRDDLGAVGNIAFSTTTFAPSGGCYAASSLDATAQAGELSVAGFGPQRTAWFYWESSDFTGTVRFWTTSSEVTDQVMAVYSSNGTFNPATPGTLLDSDDDSGAGLMPECEITATPFGEYLIQVDTKDNPGGEFTLNWVRVTASPPINDAHANAIEITGEGPATLSGTTVDATVECDEPGQDSDGPFGSVWYHINSPVDRGIEITLKATSDANPEGIKAILYRSNSPLSDLEDVTNGNYPWVFDLNEEATNAYPLAANVDYYISVSNYFENVGPSGDGATFDVTHELSSLTPPDGDEFEDPIDSSPSAPGGQILTGTTEGSTTQDAEPDVDGLDGTVWHLFEPDHDGIYIFTVDATEPGIGNPDGKLRFTVWEGPSLATIKPIPGWYVLADFNNYLYDNPRVLRAGSTYYIRVERLEGEAWGTYALNITSYPEYDDWTSADDGYDTVGTPGSYDSLNDILTYTGEGGALVQPWRDLDDNPQNAGLRWIQLRFKLRVTSGETMFREDQTNHLGVVRALDPDNDPVWELVVTGDLDGTNPLALRNVSTGATTPVFAHFGTRERDFNEWVDVEVILRAYTARDTVPTTYSTDIAINGVKRRVMLPSLEETFLATAPIRSLEFGAFYYPENYDTTITGAGSPRQDPHDDWEIEIKDVVVRNRPTLGMLPSTDVADLGVTQFDGWEHEDKLDNIDVFSTSGGSASTIVDAPGTPPGNSDWWKAVRMVNASPSGWQRGHIYNYWLHSVRPWVGFWLYMAEFPDTDDNEYVMLSYIPDDIGDGRVGWAGLMVNGSGQLRIAPQFSRRVWKSYCVGNIAEGQWYWIEMEADASIHHEASVEVSINGNSMGTFQFATSYADLQSIDTPLAFDIIRYGRFPTSRFPIEWWLGPFFKITGENRSFDWTSETVFGVQFDEYFAHACMGRAVTFPLEPMQTKLFGGIDEDGDHNFPELPVEHEHLTKGARDFIWTLYDYTDETDTPNPSVGAAPAEFTWQSIPGGGTIDVIADGTGPPLIAAFNAIRWAPRGTIPDSPFGTTHFPIHGNVPYEFFTEAEGGTSADMFVTTSWIKGVGSLSFADNSNPGGAPIYSHITGTLDGDYAQYWAAAPPAWHFPMVVSATASTRSEWAGMTVSDFMYWKRVRFLGNPKVYPRFALSADDGATWTMLDDPTVANTNTFIGDDVTVSNGEAVWMNNASAHERLMEFRHGLLFPFGDYGMHSVGYEMTGWYLEYGSVPSVEIPEAEEFGGTRGYNLHLRHGGYNYTPSTDRATGDLYITLWNGTHRAPLHVVTASTSDISRVRYPTDATGGHWTTEEFDDTLLRFGYYRQFQSATQTGTTGIDASPTAWASTQLRGAFLEAVQWEVLSQAAAGPAASRCRRMPQIYRRAFG